MNRLSRRDYAERGWAEDKRIPHWRARNARDPGAILSPADANAKRYAESPVMASIKSSAAQSVSGLVNAPAASLQAANEMVQNTMLGFGMDVPKSRVPNMPLVDYWPA